METRFGNWGHVILGATLIFTVAACDSSSEIELDPAASLDVAESVASLVSEDTGGMLDQVADVFELATAGTIEAQATEIAGKVADGSTVERSYDETTQMWTIEVSRERSDPDGDRYMSFERTYHVQFQDGDGNPRRNLVTDGSHAHSIYFRIDDGSGSLHTPRIEAERSGIFATFTATGVDTDEVTVNGTYGREGALTITGLLAERTLEYQVEIEVTDLVGPKGSRRDLSQKVSGTIAGHFEGSATFERGDIYHEREIERDFTIVISDGTQTITVNGEEFTADLRTGDFRSEIDVR